MKIYTKTGDDGTTGLLYGGRTDKNDLRIEAAGSIDEAVAALGLARATCTTPGLGELLLRLQRELFAAGAEIATAEENWRKLDVAKGTLIDASMVDSIEKLIDGYGARFTMPAEFIVPGENQGSAAIDLARAFVRRTERRCVALTQGSLLPDGEVVRYLNRLADLLFVLARYEEGGFTPLHER
ncbi:MAG TPA: cob(I)yrinic acid a,c-diamide adenosyltransferase [Actinomycetota bacterium]|nr:cob(I)yrinic acid a,c-diamide adenosyltransferase [Actinomycetota bacterium]